MIHAVKNWVGVAAIVVSIFALGFEYSYYIYQVETKDSTASYVVAATKQKIHRDELALSKDEAILKVREEKIK